MDKTKDTVFWLRTVAYLAVVGVAVSLVLTGADHLPLVLVGMVAFAAALPMYPWIGDWSPGALFALVAGEAVLVTAGQFVSGHPGTVMVLFFVLLPTCARLPRRFSLLCYTLFPALACLPFLLGPDARAEWAVVVQVVPGFLAAIAFAEGFWTYRSALEAQKKLLGELIELQRQRAPTDEPVPAPSAGGLTRRDREVLGLVALGFSNKEIAQKLFLAEGTVKNRVSQLLEKIGARDRTQAALRAREWGVV